ncbi:MAG: protein translocase SEC61 complex subunit gamma [Candidatus Micrarchaeaceae archaeon]
MSLVGKFQQFIDNSKHVLSVSYKPTTAEFDRSAKLIIIGILLLGFLGLVIAVIISLFVTGSFVFV